MSVYNAGAVCLLHGTNRMLKKKIQFNAEARVRYQTRLFVVDKRALGQAFRE